MLDSVINLILGVAKITSMAMFWFMFFCTILELPLNTAKKKKDFLYSIAFIAVCAVVAIALSRGRVGDLLSFPLDVLGYLLGGTSA